MQRLRIRGIALERERLRFDGGEVLSRLQSKIRQQVDILGRRSSRRGRPGVLGRALQPQQSLLQLLTSRRASADRFQQPGCFGGNRCSVLLQGRGPDLIERCRPACRSARLLKHQPEREVLDLLPQIGPAGHHAASWDRTGSSSGNASRP